MKDVEMFDKIAKYQKDDRGIAMAVVTLSAGSSPADLGDMMIVLDDGQTEGSVGGGALEHTVIKEALKCISDGVCKEFSYSLEKGGDLEMTCGGDVRVFIKVFNRKKKLVVVGGGHIGLELYKLGLAYGFSVTVVDDREEFASKLRFPEATQVVCGDISKSISQLNIDSSSYIAIATRSHQCDEDALRSVVGSDAAYIGMIGSRKKVAHIMNNLLNDFDIDVLSKVYAPMGLDIASEKTGEIALSIMSEIMLVKNNGSAEHMRNLKGFTSLKS